MWFLGLKVRLFICVSGEGQKLVYILSAEMCIKAEQNRVWVFISCDPTSGAEPVAFSTERSGSGTVGSVISFHCESGP